MTGNNKYVLSVFATMMKQPDIPAMVQSLPATFGGREIHILHRYGIPVNQIGITSKPQLFEYILEEVKTYVPIAQKSSSRQYNKAANRLGREIIRAFKGIEIVDALGTAINKTQ